VLPVDYVNWLRSYLSNRELELRVSGIHSSPSEVLLGVSKGSGLGHLLFNVFINDLCDAAAHSKYQLFADDIEIYRTVKSAEDCKFTTVSC
jgi:hypothetical protein